MSSLVTAIGDNRPSNAIPIASLQKNGGAFRLEWKDGLQAAGAAPRGRVCRFRWTSMKGA
jgi:hypothetical protein